MINVRFELNGRPVRPGDLRNAFEKAVMESVREHIVKHAGSARCPVHGQAPEVVATGRSLDDLTFEVRGCCEAIRDEVVEKLS